MVASFHALLQVQHLRMQVSTWMGCIKSGTVGGQIESLIQGLQGLALAARGGGLDAFAGMCQHFSGQLEPARHAGLLSGDSLQLLGAWLGSVDRYLRQPSNPGATAELVARFTALPWEASSNPALQGSLFRALLLPV